MLTEWWYWGTTVPLIKFKLIKFHSKSAKHQSSQFLYHFLIKFDSILSFQSLKDNSQKPYYGLWFLSGSQNLGDLLVYSSKPQASIIRLYSSLLIRAGDELLHLKPASLHLRASTGPPLSYYGYTQQDQQDQQVNPPVREYSQEILFLYEH